MTDRHVFADDRRAILGDVEHRVVLDVRARADTDRAVIAPDDRAEPNTRFGPDLDVADEDGGRSDEGGMMDLRRLALVFDDHARSSANVRTVPLRNAPRGPS